MEFIAYKSNETYENKYYQIPQELLINKLYKNKLNSDSKLLYGFLLDRLTLSIKNHWYDENNYVYLIYTRKEVSEKLNLSDKTVTKAFNLLKEVNLLYEKRQGMGKPNLIYVGKIKHEDTKETENLRFKSSKKYDSRQEKNTNIESEKLRRINTNNINTNIAYPKSNDESYALDVIKSNAKLYEFDKNEIMILEEIIDRLYNSKSLKIGQNIIDNAEIRFKLKFLSKDNLMQLIYIQKNNNNIKNIPNYLMICLYNSLGNCYMNKDANNKKSNYIIKERNYTNEFLESFYFNTSLS